MKKLSSLLFLFACSVYTLYAAKVDTVMVHSDSMNKGVEAIVVMPSGIKANIPVIYLLHGYSGDARSWIGLKPNLPEIADQMGIAFVCPDGKNSWYWDSPKDPSSCYETFVAKELVSYVDANYPVKKDRSGRAITGLSMGGHGAMWLGLRHKDVFGAAGSTSGGVDIRPFPNNWEMSTLLGDESSNRDLWEQYTVINQIDRLKNGDLAIIIDCGYGDFFYEVNQDLHKKLCKYQIDHEFQVRPGVHNADYWRNSIDFQILFFKKFFDRKK
ncbi:MAG: alpha/beta hydrolase family protein [Massilibacteroides sp.]|nr:alpha/beta hydrolase family protein [Massilibacteroides sp.]MDD3063398.1 alpha/beta hydrolase family protein [Massilibacteroides sp.]MDD4115287.1 alpha/beta hydrolase family protein [Massilibacteroides sp.]MDD4661147.1 alpha/beta hydrolase family protein [Massilibacteroides sp.]